MELTYSIVCGRGVRLFDGGIHGSYAVVSGAIVDALSDAGIDAEFSPADRAKRGPRGGSCFSAATRYEVLVDGKKLAGSAQRRFNDVFLLQGTVLFDVDAPLNEAVFGRGAAGNMAWINALSPLSEAAFRELLIARLEVALNARFFKTGLSAEETRLKQGLVTSRYSSDEWNLHGRSDDKPAQTNGPRTIQGPARGVEA